MAWFHLIKCLLKLSQAVVLADTGEGEILNDNWLCLGAHSVLFPRRLSQVLILIWFMHYITDELSYIAKNVLFVYYISSRSWCKNRAGMEIMKKTKHGHCMRNSGNNEEIEGKRRRKKGATSSDKFHTIITIHTFKKQLYIPPSNLI